MPKKKQISSPRLYKTIFACDYFPKLDFFNHIISAAQALEGYPDWEVSWGNVSLINRKNHYSLTIQHNRFVYEQDLDKISNEEKYIEEALIKIPDSLNISSYQRLGFRRKYLIPTEMSFKELATVMNLRLLSQDERLKKIMSSQIQKFINMVEYSEGNLNLRIQVAPIKKEEVIKVMEFNKDLHLNPSTGSRDYQTIIDSCHDVSVFVDIDVFRIEKDIPLTEGIPFFKQVGNKLDRLISDLNEYLFRVKLEA